MQIPTIGRVVHFHFINRDGKLVARPAIIVNDWGADKPDAAVNLRVFLDGKNDADAINAAEWQTSVKVAEEPTAGSFTWPKFVAPAKATTPAAEPIAPTTPAEPAKPTT